MLRRGGGKRSRRLWAEETVDEGVGIDTVWLGLIPCRHGINGKVLLLVARSLLRVMDHGVSVGRGQPKVRILSRMRSAEK